MTPFQGFKNMLF